MHYYFGVLTFLYKAGALFIGNNAAARRVSHQSMANYNSSKPHLHDMELNPNPDNHDIKGKQRIAVYNALKRPVTGRQILASAKQTAPSMSYQDLRHILRDFQQRGIAACLNPENQTGRIYVLSSARNDHPIAPGLIDIFSRISRAKNRLAVLKEVAKERFIEPHPLTATQIKRYLREEHPLGLNHVLAALTILESLQLIKTAGRTPKRELKIYEVTELGKTILSYLE